MALHADEFTYYGISRGKVSYTHQQQEVLDRAEREYRDARAKREAEMWLKHGGRYLAIVTLTDDDGKPYSVAYSGPTPDHALEHAQRRAQADQGYISASLVLDAPALYTGEEYPEVVR